MELGSDVTSTVQPQARLIRPVDHRWDRSRGIIFAASKRPISGDFTWTRSDGIVFGEAPAYRRSYANRNLFAPQSSSQRGPPQTKPQNVPDSTLDTHKPLSASAFGSGHLLEDLNRANKALQENWAKSEQAIQEERRKHAAEVSKLRKQHVTDIDGLRKQHEADLAKLQNEAKEHEQLLEGQIRASEARLQDELRQSAESKRVLERREADMIEGETDLNTRKASLDATIAQAQHDAQETADQRVQGLVEAAQNREAEATDLLQRYPGKIDQAVDRVIKEEINASRKHKKRLEEANAKEMRAIAIDGLERESTGLADYDSYHRVWDEVLETYRRYSSEIVQVYGLLYRKAEYSRDMASSFDGSKINPSFPHRYPQLNHQLQGYLETGTQELKISADILKDLRRTLTEAMNELTRLAHVSRLLTKYHKFDATTNEYRATNLANKMLNEEPLRRHRELLEKQIVRNKERLDGTIDNTTRRLLQQARSRDINQHAFLKRLLSFFIDIREMEGLKDLRQGSIDEKAIFLMTQKARSVSDLARQQWNFYTTENPVAIEDGETSLQQKMYEREVWLQRWNEARKEHDDLVELMRKRRALEFRLGEVKDDEAECNVAIDKQIEQVKARMDASLETVLRGGSGGVGRLRQASLSARSAPVLPAPQPSRPDLHQCKKQLRAVIMKRQDTAGPSTEKEKQKEAENLRALVVEAEKHITLLIQRRVRVIQNNPNDHAAALHFQNDIEELKGLVTQAEMTDSPMEKSSSLAAIPAATKAHAAKDLESHRANARNYSFSGRKSRLRAKRLSARPVVRTPVRGWVGTTLEQQNSSVRGQMSFKPTAPRHAPDTGGLTYQRHAFVEDRQQNHTTTVPHRSPSMDSFDSFEGYMAMSQAMRQLSLESARENSDDRHVDADVTFPHDFFSMANHSFVLPLQTDRSCQASESDERCPVSSVIHSSDQSIDSESAAERSFAMATPAADEEPPIELTKEANNMPLTYNIRPNEYRDAVLASQNSSAAFWSFKLYKNEEGKTPKAYYTTNYHLTEERAREFLNEAIIGFDIEWEPFAKSSSSPRQNVSLIQIAAEDKIGLFHIALFNGETPDKLMPPSLRAILESREIIKAGVNISGDANRLHKYLDVEMKGLFELSHLYRVVTFSAHAPEQVNKRLVSMAEQVQKILGLPLKKDSVRTSAWAKKLQVEQTNYAASDAYAGFRLFHELERKRKMMDPVPPRPACWEEHKPLQLGNGDIVVSKIYNSRSKRGVVLDDVEQEVEEDDESEESFEAPESSDIGFSSSQTISQTSEASNEASISHSQAESSQDSPDASQDVVLSQPGVASDDSSQNSEAHTVQEHPNRRQTPSSPEVIRAENWVVNWRASLPVGYSLKANMSQLRAYHMWHEQGLDCRTVAGLLNNPPLSIQTVAGYVMKALKQEHLPYDAERVREPLEILPRSVQGTYQKVLERSGQ